MEMKRTGSHCHGKWNGNEIKEEQTGDHKTDVSGTFQVCRFFILYSTSKDFSNCIILYMFCPIEFMDEMCEKGVK